MKLNITTNTVFDAGDNRGTYNINDMIPSDTRGIDKSVYVECINRIMNNYNINFDNITNLYVMWHRYPDGFSDLLVCHFTILHSTTLLLYNDLSSISNMWGVSWRSYATSLEDYVCTYKTNNTYSLSTQSNYAAISTFTNEDPYPYLQEWTEGSRTIWTYISGLTVKTPPYEQGGYSEAGGGEGSYDNSSDEQGLEDYQINLVNNSGLTIFQLTPNEFGELSRDLQDPSILQLISNIFGLNPLESIINLYIAPFFSTVASETAPLKIGAWKTPYDFLFANEQMVVYDCGKINISEYWGNFLDYAPHTKISIFLPYIGEYDLPVDNVMNCEIGLRYIFDLLTGVTSAEIYNYTKKVQVATYTANVAYKLPLTSTEHTELIQGLLTFGAAVATKGLATKMGGASAHQVMSATDKHFSQLLGSNWIDDVTGSEYMNIYSSLNKQQEHSIKTLKDGSDKLRSNAVMNLMSNKVSVERFGDISNSAVFFSYPIPYIRIIRPQVSIPEQFNKLYGYPSNITAVLGDLSGYTEVQEVHLENIPNALSEEITMINNLLVGGIIL